MEAGEGYEEQGCKDLQGACQHDNTEKAAFNKIQLTRAVDGLPLCVQPQPQSNPNPQSPSDANPNALRTLARCSGM